MNLTSLHLSVILAFAVVFFLCVVQLLEFTLRAPVPSSPSPSLRSRYRLVDKYSDSTFFDGFNYENEPDPTHGHVQYLSRPDAQSSNLTFTGLDGTCYIYADHSTHAPLGRRSIRISTRKQYTRGLFVLDVVHVPSGCGTWPAFWTTAKTAWPRKGEIDILEGVNGERDNAFTLHTATGCRMARYRVQKGSTESVDCDVNAWNQYTNQGCSVKTTDSFSDAINERGGAVVVMQWTKKVIRMWMFDRDKVPFDIEVEAPTKMDEDWGLPDASFDDAECDIETMFKDHVVIINTTFCGDWAGQVYAQSQCPGTDCAAFVTNNPEAFKDAYWAIKSLKVYQFDDE